MIRSGWLQYCVNSAVSTLSPMQDVARLHVRRERGQTKPEVNYPKNAAFLRQNSVSVRPVSFSNVTA